MSGSNKKAVLSIEGLMDQPVNVKMTGGREVCGVLKGYDKDLNLVLDETREFLRDKIVCFFFFFFFFIIKLTFLFK